jgi:predicted thioesterase
MQNPFKKGDIKTFSKIVLVTEIAKFESGTVHEVYSTFSIAQDAEWSGRLFVLEIKEDGEEGIGTKISVEHKSPAFVGDEVNYIATFEEITERGEIITSFQAFCGDRLIAKGTQGQRILLKSMIEEKFKEFRI